MGFVPFLRTGHRLEARPDLWDIMDPETDIQEREQGRICRKWTPEEDELLKQAIIIYGAQNWKAISSHVGSRNHFQCRQRWRQVSGPSTCFSHTQTQILVQRHRFLVSVDQVHLLA